MIMLPFIKKILKITLLLSAAAAFFSCAGSASAAHETAYRMIYFSHIVPLFQNVPESKPRMDFKFCLLEASGRPKDIAFINTNLYQGKSPIQYRDAVIKEWQERYLGIRELASQHPNLMILNWEYLETMDYYMLKDRGMIIGRKKYTYSGGAHGMEKTQYFVFDLADHRVLKYDNLFREGTEERLHDIVISELRHYNNSNGPKKLEEKQPLSQGIFFDDKPCMTDNFFINNEGLGLNWALYEIAPYSAGTIEIIIPWRTIRPLLQHETMELLEKFGIYMFM